jgi:GTP:adenosylcobinamide-phosphate guanylyltransferase
LIKLNAIVLGGGKIALDDPLYQESPDGLRSLIEVHGKPMVQWVIDALDASQSVANLYVIGLPPDSGLKASKPMHYLPDYGDLFENMRKGVMLASQDHPEHIKVLIASADIPAIKPEMVDWLAEQIAADPTQMIYYNVITQESMEARFPNANRSYVRFKDCSICGGDLNAADKSLYSVERPIWQKLTEARKKPLKQAGMIGLDTLLLIALKRITLEGAVKKVCRRLSIQGKALHCPYAEMAMDADKPHQLSILRQHLREGA